MFEHNVVMPLLNGIVMTGLWICLAFILAVAYYIISEIIRDSRQRYRKQVLKNYRKAEAHIQWRLQRSEITGVLYSKGG